MFGLTTIGIDISDFHRAGIPKKTSKRNVSGCHPASWTFILLSFFMYPLVSVLLNSIYTSPLYYCISSLLIDLDFLWSLFPIILLLLVFPPESLEIRTLGILRAQHIC